MADDCDFGDSLFEGMVLFSPQIESVESPAAPPPHTHHHHQEEEDQSSTSVPTDSIPSSSFPLDENLFSDLTVVVEAPSPPTPEASSLPPAITHQRQNSIHRKKKKAAGLRIGYARDSKEANTNSDDTYLPIQEQYHPSSVVTVANDSTIDLDLPAEDAEEDTAAPFSSADLLQGEDKLLPVKVTTTTGSTSTIDEGLRLEEIRNLIEQKLKHAKDAVASASVARKDSIKSRRQAADNLTKVSAKYAQLEKELEEACETEDFEKAEKVSDSLSSAEWEREMLLAALRDAEADCDSLDLKMKEALELQIQAEEECASLLQTFALDASNNADLVAQNAKQVSSKEMEEWLLSTEEVELQKLELDIESHLINEARLSLNNSIERSVEDDRRERDLLYKRREILREDLEKLLALVREKEAEILENDFNIEGVQKRIAGVVSSFEEVQSTLDAKCNNLQSGLHQVESKCDILSKRKKKTEDLLCQEETREEKMREISRISMDEANMFQEVVVLRKSLLQFILHFMQDKVRLSKTVEKLSEDVNMLRREISSCRASLQELSSSKSSIQQEVETFKQRLLFIDKRVPELEAEKKVAATARNFKEAARISSEAKALCVEKDGLEIKMENAILELKKLEEQISYTINRLQETEPQVLSKEKELAMARFQRLILIADAASAERSAASELGDIEEANVLLAEADASTAEARKLQPLYNFSDEDLANLPKHFVPMELISKLGGKQLAEILESINILAQ